MAPRQSCAVARSYLTYTSAQVLSEVAKEVNELLVKASVKTLMLDHGFGAEHRCLELISTNL